LFGAAHTKTKEARYKRAEDFSWFKYLLKGKVARFSFLNKELSISGKLIKNRWLIPPLASENKEGYYIASVNIAYDDILG
jgi:hypothetical protein